MPKVRKCPECGLNMHRAYIKLSYTVRETGKRSSRLMPIGWFCFYCKKVHLDDIKEIYYPDVLIYGFLPEYDFE